MLKLLVDKVTIVFSQLPKQNWHVWHDDTGHWLLISQKAKLPLKPVFFSIHLWTFPGDLGGIGADLAEAKTVTKLHINAKNLCPASDTNHNYDHDNVLHHVSYDTENSMVKWCSGWQCLTGSIARRLEWMHSIKPSCTVSWSQTTLHKITRHHHLMHFLCSKCTKIHL